jgi:hypothetical protein
MGNNSSTSSGGSSNLDSLRERDKAMAAQTNRQKAEQEAKSRQDSFDQYNKMQQASPEGGAAQLPSKATMSTVKNNISIAQNLEQKAKSSEINVPIPTVGTVAMKTISSMNYNN